MNARKNGKRNGELVTVEQQCENSNLGRATVMKIAKEAGALVRIGRSVRIIPEKFYAHIEKEYIA